MDNITHTLVGAALAEAGLKRRTALGAATLMIGANFPDIDVVAVPLGMGIEWRRGTTHGFLALAVLPFVLAGIMLLWDRRVRLRRTPDAVPANPRQILLLSAIAIATHPTLDFMNIYGMRWLMPFRDQWFYADGLFIIDFWILVGLAVAVYLSRRNRSTRPARIALAGLATYVVLMLGVTSLGRARVAADFPGRRFMVEPNGVVPWRRDFTVEVDHGYQFGTYRPLQPLFVQPGLLPIGDQDPAAKSAQEAPKVRRFLRWARFPTYEVTRDRGQTEVVVGDARYPGASWASVVVRLP